MFRTLTRKWLVPRRAHWRFGGKAYGVRVPPEMTPQLEMEFARLHESYREAETVPEQYGLLLTMCLLAYVDDDGEDGEGADAGQGMMSCWAHSVFLSGHICGQRTAG